jgi:NADPH:quinone reductase-like Zn-dependent oxidoreductase
MKAIRIHQYGDAATLKLEDVPRMSIADHQLLVRIHDAGVNPIDWNQARLHEAGDARDISHDNWSGFCR